MQSPQTNPSASVSSVLMGWTQVRNHPYGPNSSFLLPFLLPLCDLVPDIPPWATGACFGSGSRNAWEFLSVLFLSQQLGTWIHGGHVESRVIAR